MQKPNAYFCFTLCLLFTILSWLPTWLVTLPSRMSLNKKHRGEGHSTCQCGCVNSHPRQKYIGNGDPVFQNGNTNILIRGIDLSQTYNKLALWDVTPHEYNEEKFFYGRITLSDVAVFHSSVSMSRFFSEWQGHLAPGRSPLLPIKDSPRATRNFARKGVVTTELGSVTPAQNLFAFYIDNSTRRNGVSI